MNLSASYIPKCTVPDVKSLLTDLSFPEPESITFLSSKGALHQIAELKWSSSETLQSVLASHNVSIDVTDPTKTDTDSNANHDGIASCSNTALILRISGPSLPKIATENEVATLFWLTKHTTIPVPRIICHDSSINNALGSEYMIMTRMLGDDGARMYKSLLADTPKMDYVLDQLADHVMQLWKKPFNYIGGLRMEAPTRTEDQKSESKQAETASDKEGTENQGSSKPSLSPDATLDKTSNKIQKDADIIPGPVIDETQWSVPDIAKYWPTTVSFSDLNPTSPTGYPNLSSYLSAYMTRYIAAIPLHPALQSLPYLSHQNIQLLKAFVDALEPEPQPKPKSESQISKEPSQSPDQNQTSTNSLLAQINSSPHILSHRDLHFGQLLLDPQTARITAILDWEFAQVTSFPLWERSFLWSGDTTIPHSSFTRAERGSLRQRWRDRATAVFGDVGERMLQESQWTCESQQAAWDVVNFMRCIVEVVPRGIQLEDAKGWWGEVVRGLRVLGIGMGRQGSISGLRGNGNGTEMGLRSLNEISMSVDGGGMSLADRNDGSRKMEGNDHRQGGVNGRSDSGSGDSSRDRDRERDRHRDQDRPDADVLADAKREISQDSPKPKGVELSEHMHKILVDQPSQ